MNFDRRQIVGPWLWWATFTVAAMKTGDIHAAGVTAQAACARMWGGSSP